MPVSFLFYFFVVKMNQNQQFDTAFFNISIIDWFMYCEDNIEYIGSNILCIYTVHAIDFKATLKRALLKIENTDETSANF